MSTCIALLRWTPRGRQNIGQDQYDMIFILEAPGDAALAKAILGARTQGSVISEI